MTAGFLVFAGLLADFCGGDLVIGAEVGAATGEGGGESVCRDAKADGPEVETEGGSVLFPLVPFAVASLQHRCAP